ncbi:MAG: ATP synthase F1 subunit gamma [Acidobacteriaceae bacterium]|nr:ATP synthase F1 subunit gamma [Acidobacteriaceae bacterium]MBV9781886.1 ATP synthase F1 subunit gamma [Acidobacteriaceae bacterium]
MPSLIDIRRRIRSVKNMQQITKAMKMVSAAKLRRAQDRAIASRPYGKIMHRVLSNLAAAAAGDQAVADLPLLQTREEKRIQLIVVSSDTGLAGGFNANLFRMAHRFLDEHRGAEISIETVGRKGRDYFRKRNFTITGEHIGIVEKPNYEQARAIADKMIDRYRKSEVDAVYIALNEFKNIMASNLVAKRILPVEVPEGGEQINYIYEQPPEELLRVLLPRYIEMEIFRAMLESISAYHAARMTAMDSATSNAGDVIQTLTLNMNRVRQAAITREIIEIVSGAAAL